MLFSHYNRPVFFREQCILVINFTFIRTYCQLQIHNSFENVKSILWKRSLENYLLFLTEDLQVMSHTMQVLTHYFLCANISSMTSVIRQKSESQNGYLKKTKHVCKRIRGLKMIVFREIWRALFSLNTRFEIRTFALLPTKKGLLQIL